MRKNDPKGYLFYALGKEFKAEIDRHQERTGIIDAWTGRLKDYANRHMNGLREHRTDLEKATEHFREMWESLGRFKGIEGTTRQYDRRQQQIDINHDRSDCGAWRIKDFLVTTPLKFEERVVEQYNKMIDAKWHKAEIAYRKTRSWEYQNGELVCCGQDKRMQIEDKVRNHVISDFYDYPGTIIIAAFESFVLKYTGFNRQDYLQTYIPHLDYVICQYNRGTRSRRRIESFAKELKGHEGDLETMGSIIAKDLAENQSGLEGMPSYSSVKPRYYRTAEFNLRIADPATIQFPSAQADFVAARLIASQMVKHART